MKRLVILVVSISEFILVAAQSSVGNQLSHSTNKTFPDVSRSRNITTDNTFLIKDDSLYNVTVDYIWKIKNAFYIEAHTDISDTIVHVKIIEPKVNNNSTMSRIKVGNTYSMRLFRYYPYPLKHSTDYYLNYNFLFGNSIVCVQATDCLSYIFTTNNLVGLSYYSKNDGYISNNSIDRYRRVKDQEVAYKTFNSIIRKDILSIIDLVDTSQVMANLKKMAISFSIVDHKHIHCLPPYRLEKKTQYYNSKLKRLSFPDKLYYLITYPAVFDTISAKEFEKALVISKIDVVYHYQDYITCRILWHSTLTSYNYCTYLSFKYWNDTYKLVGVSSF